MSRLLSCAVALLALVFAPLADGAEAGVGDRAADVLLSCNGGSPIERAQYFSFDDEDYCWYDDGWNGPGWYWCGDEWYEGYGWGGPYGWNGWGGGYYIRRYPPHGVGVWHPGAPSRRVGPGGAGAPVGPVAPGLRGGGEGPHRLGASGAPVRPALPSGALHGGEAPAFHGPSGGGKASGAEASTALAAAEASTAAGAASRSDAAAVGTAERDYRQRALSCSGQRGASPARNIRSRNRAGQLADCAASVASRVPIASRRSSCAFAAMSSIEGELASSERARRTISALLGM
jgi:hypothetical protein